MTLAKFEPKKRVDPTGQGDVEIRSELIGVVRDFDASHSRSQQTAIGLSEIGHPCARRIAYKRSGFPEPVNPSNDPWLTVIGTATHAWLANALAHANAQAGWERYLIEKRVWVRPDLSGTGDVLDQQTNTVIDHKIVGKSSMDKYKLHGPGPQYEIQGHSYGFGWEQAGFTVERVAIAFYPRFTWLDAGFFVWSAPYDRVRVEKAIRRLDTIDAIVSKLNPAIDPEQFTRIPRSPDRNCRYCPFWKPGKDTGATCPGED